MDSEGSESSQPNKNENNETKFDAIFDIIDYLVRCANVSFKNSHLNEREVRSVDKTRYAYDLFSKSPTEFLLQFGKYLCPNHINYFEKLNIFQNDKDFELCVSQLKLYHSEESRNKRVRNRRYKALKNLQNTTDYFSEKQMMYRNPLLYEQLVGQYLTEEEIKVRDSADSENFTLLSLILDTVDRNQMRETKNMQMLIEDTEAIPEDTEAIPKDAHADNAKPGNSRNKKQWGEFDIPDTKDVQKPEIRKQTIINANERNLLREEFLQEMYSSFIEGCDIEFDYNTVDSNEDYDDLEQISQDAEDKYFDSEGNDSQSLEEHMTLVQEYGSKNHKNDDIDPLDVFMERISSKLNNVT